MKKVFAPRRNWAPRCSHNLPVSHDGDWDSLALNSGVSYCKCSNNLQVSISLPCQYLMLWLVHPRPVKATMWNYGKDHLIKIRKMIFICWVPAIILDSIFMIINIAKSNRIDWKEFSEATWGKREMGAVWKGERIRKVKMKGVAQGQTCLPPYG